MATTTRILDANVNGTVYTSNANSALEALDTCHSGAVAPTDEVANGKLWLDTSTTPGILKMYNNAAWEEIGGSASSPTFAGLTTTGTLVATSVSSGTLVAGTATYGGTADVITITTGLSLAALTTGMEIRFRATAANTGATTINVDGIGAVAALTITGAALPATYIRTDVDTVIRYNGTNWIADRQIERGTNANGEYTRWADGTQWAYESISIGAPNTWTGSSGSYYTTGTWTYPITFAETPYITCSGDQQQVLASSIANIIITVRRRSSNSATAALWGAREVRVTNNANGALIDLHATGLWY